MVITGLKACYVAVSLAFTAHTEPNSSPSYVDRWHERHAGKRISECLKLWRISERPDKYGLQLGDTSYQERLWVLATAIEESGFDKTVKSGAGALSSMQTYRRYAPEPIRSNPRLPLRRAGVYHAIKRFRAYDTCDAAAKYNAPEHVGSCNGAGGKYASRVVSYYEDLCEALDVDCTIDKGC